MSHLGREKFLARLVRILLVGFVLGLVVSGVTAFPLRQEVDLLARWMGASETARAGQYGGMLGWIVTVRNGLRDTDVRFPYLFYGTDWLAFGHLVIALAFLGPLKDPVRNVWIIRWAMMACVFVIPLALICGEVRGIPLGWRFIDCSFGVVGIIPLLICDRAIRELDRIRSAAI